MGIQSIWFSLKALPSSHILLSESVLKLYSGNRPEKRLNGDCTWVFPWST